MKCKLSKQAYQWDDGQQWHVGRLVQESDDFITYYEGVTCEPEYSDRVLVRHSHTSELEFVEWGKLQTYPQGKIPEPTNTGRTA